MRWGILGTGHIANRFAGQLAALGDRSRMRSVGARDPIRARAFALQHDIACSGTYADVLADPQVEAVYIALLNRDHARWAIAAARAGKHILCEKPAALHAAELEDMLSAAAAAKVRFVEAFAYRFHPRWAILRRRLADLGGPLIAQAGFCFHAGNPVKPRLLDPVGGGVLMDIGCYPLSWLLALLGSPQTVRCTARCGPGGVDLAAAVSLSFADGHVAQALCACDAPMPQAASISGPGGSIDIAEPYRSTRGSSFILRTSQGEQEIAWQDDGLELYAREAIAVETIVDGIEHPAMTWTDSRLLARTIDACRAQIGLHWPDEPVR
jgi:D-xylose 1-dehydrogenase (NADP+, D-xylono-1,5-lactone-forming)